MELKEFNKLMKIFKEKNKSLRNSVKEHLEMSSFYEARNDIDCLEHIKEIWSKVVEELYPLIKDRRFKRKSKKK